MKLKEIVLMATLGASTLVGCKREEPKTMLESLAVAWTKSNKTIYTKVEDARKVIYRLADTNRDGQVSYNEAKAMIERCPESTGYNCI